MLLQRAQSTRAANSPAKLSHAVMFFKPHDKPETDQDEY